jgi:hypothetical protein
MRRSVVAAACLPVITVIAGWVLAVRSGLLIHGNSDAVTILTTISVVLLVVGLLAERRRPGNPISVVTLVLAATAGISLWRLLPYRWPAVLGALVWYAAALAPAHLVLAYPDGAGTGARRLVAVCWLLPAALAVGLVLTSGPRRMADEATAVRAATWADNATALRPPNPLAVLESASAARALATAWSFAVIAGTLATVMILTARWVRAPRQRRRVVRPVFGAALVWALAQLVQPIAALPETGGGLPAARLRQWYGTSIVVLPTLAVAVVAGALLYTEVVRPRLAHSTGGGLELQASGIEGAERVRRWLAHALGDPTLKLAFHDPTSGGWVDASGVVVELAESDRRAATIVERGGEPVAALEYDVSLTAQLDVVDVAAAMAALALDNERLHAVNQARVEDTRASAVRLLSAADHARAAVEQRLHEGPDRILAGLEHDLMAGATAEAAVFDAAHARLRDAVAEVRRVAHGLHPSSLQDDGLAAALDDLAAANPRVRFGSMPAQRGPIAVELTLYLAIADAAGHSLGPIDVDITAEDGVEATIGGWSGPVDQLVADRVATLGGSIQISDDEVMLALPVGSP